ncbi:MAG: hypothetical protein SGILL_010235 [Bacillariaceae sp.]
MSNASATNIASTAALSDGATQVVFVNDDELRPSGHFPKGYRVLNPYSTVAYGEVILKPSREGRRMQNGVKIEADISPKRSARATSTSTCTNGNDRVSAIKEISCSPL